MEIVKKNGRESARIQVTLTDSVVAKLDRLQEAKGISRSALMALAIDELYRKEISNV